jgi:hypothetical protein
VPKADLLKTPELVRSGLCPCNSGREFTDRCAICYGPASQKAGLNARATPSQKYRLTIDMMAEFAINHRFV